MSAEHKLALAVSQEPWKNKLAMFIYITLTFTYVMPFCQILWGGEVEERYSALSLFTLKTDRGIFSYGQN